jgi:hypothetical protein
VGDTLPEGGAGGEFRVEVDRVVVAGHDREQLDIPLVNLLAVARLLTDADFVKGIVAELAHARILCCGREREL